MKTKNWWLIPAIVGGFGLIVVVTFMIILNANNIEPLGVDIAVRDFFYSFRGEKGGFVYWLFRILTEFGDIIGIAVMTVLLISYTKCDYRVCLLLIGAALTFLVNKGFKEIFDRERPIEALRWQYESSTSFPSGHSANSSFLFAYLTYVVYKSDLKDVIKKVLYVVFPLMILIVMSSRMVLGVHYFSDVCAGACVGLMMASIVMVLHNICEKKEIFTTNLYEIIKSKRNK